ncbi:MAG: short-chain dehydrogenase [Proteobacteria bacterium]|nr:short-chain dehydrogenase [Pseudomonadota bacterium]
MNLEGCRTLLTGAGSGIGRCLALALGARGAKLVLVGRNATRLTEVAREIVRAGGYALAVAHDLSAPAGHDQLVLSATNRLGGIDLLINNAGIAGFGEFAAEDPAGIDNLINTNITAPLLLTRAVLPAMLESGTGRIVNVGSILGSIGFPHFAAYSASKFALRGFSEALRRELAGSGIGVTYVAPRTTRTTLNSDTLYELSAASGAAVDDPATVAAIIVEAIAADRDEIYIGWPEKLAVRLNALLPRLISLAIGKQVAAARQLLRTTGPRPATAPSIDKYE